MAEITTASATAKKLNLARLRARHADEERKLIRAALVAADWRLSSAASLLGVFPSSLQSYITRRYPEIGKERDRRWPPGEGERARGVYER